MPTHTCTYNACVHAHTHTHNFLKIVNDGVRDTQKLVSGTESPGPPLTGWTVRLVFICSALLRWPRSGQWLLCSSFLCSSVTPWGCHSCCTVETLAAGRTCLTSHGTGRTVGKRAPQMLASSWFFGVLLGSHLLLCVSITLPLPEPLGLWPSESSRPLMGSCWFP